MRYKKNINTLFVEGYFVILTIMLKINKVKEIS